jgi:hypothetical protein
MISKTATLIDTSGIQSYIFGSNRLRENIGASYLVKQATEAKIKEFLEPEDQLIYSGGGNALLQFDSLEAAQSFTQKYTRELLETHPGLQIAIAHHSFSPEDSLQTVRQHLEQKIAKKKRSGINSAPLLGLGITATCKSTQMPAISHTSELPNTRNLPKHDQYLVSREVKAKLNAIEDANNQLKRECNFSNEQYLFPYDVDDMGRSEGASSYMAVVHIDGNSMGQRFIDYSSKFTANDEYIAGMKVMSESVDTAGKEALRQTLERLIRTIERSTELHDRLKLTPDKKQRYLPFRPLVYGGDDISFICDGRLGLSLAIAYLQALQKQNAADGKPIQACAGVCIVKTHYPFARAYQMSEVLCASGKQFLRDLKQNDEALDCCVIDWHITGSGLLGTLEDIRSREYTVPQGSLCIRPMPLYQVKSHTEWHHWNAFSKVVQDFNIGKEWRDRKNKTIALRDVLRKGDKETEQFLKAYRLPDFPEFAPPYDMMRRTGWSDLNQQEVSPYFDAIEAMEFHTPLED